MPADSCSYSPDYNYTGSATQQSEACASVEDKTKVAQPWGTLLSNRVCLQQRKVSSCSTAAGIASSKCQHMIIQKVLIMTWYLVGSCKPMKKNCLSVVL